MEVKSDIDPIEIEKTCITSQLTNKELFVMLELLEMLKS
jgi:hypothetical protein